MSKRTAQQARALFEVAERASETERIATELEWFAGVLRLPDAARTLLNPIVPPDKKGDIVRALSASASLSAAAAWVRARRPSSSTSANPTKPWNMPS